MHATAHKPQEREMRPHNGLLDGALASPGERVRVKVREGERERERGRERKLGGAGSRAPEMSRSSI